MKISVIIPTFNREKDLRICLDSIISNSLGPMEVIIIDQGDTYVTKQLVASLHVEFDCQVHFFSIKSAAAARNKGIELSRGDILVFIDDDVELGFDFFKTVEKIFIKYPEYIGITGKDLASQIATQKGIFSWIKRLFGVIFQVSSFSNKNIVLPSGQNILANTSDLSHACQWLSGCNMVIRKNALLDGHQFYDKFIRWSFGEDVMFSYKLYKQYGDGSLQYIPSLQLSHHQSLHSRILKDEVIKMKIIYRYIFWKKEIADNNILTVFPYMWSQFGLFLLDLWEYGDKKIISLYIESLYFLFINRHKIVSGEVDYNKFIISEL